MGSNAWAPPRAYSSDPIIHAGPRLFEAPSRLWHAMVTPACIRDRGRHSERLFPTLTLTPTPWSPPRSKSAPDPVPTHDLAAVSHLSREGRDPTSDEKIIV